MKLFLLSLLVAAAIFAFATPAASEEATCSPWLGLCYQTADCCRHLQCLTYASKCVPVSGIIIPGMDTRPIGPGPYPPGFPNQ